MCNCIYRGGVYPAKGMYYWEAICSCDSHKHIFEGQKGTGHSPKRLRAKHITKAEVATYILLRGKDKEKAKKQKLLK